jgi:anti-anti-sigma regulatory factor
MVQERILKTGKNNMEIISDLTIFNVANLQDKFAEMVAGEGQIVLDLKDLQECDTAGIQLLVSLKKEAVGCGKEFQVINVPSCFSQTIEAIGFDLNGFTCN